jgi:hypothetical protein
MNLQKYLIIVIGIFIFLIFSIHPLYCQTIQQTITLEPGWNAVFLEIEPQNNTCTTIFSPYPVASVWTWNPKTSPVEYIQNPEELLPEHEQWLTWYPPERPYAYKTNLFSLIGERAYLIQLDGQQEISITLEGRPCIPKIDWKADSVNLVGFHVMPGQEPFFSDFFGPSDAHGNDNPQVYWLNDSGRWEQITQLQTTRISHGTAYWIQCNGVSDYVGPIKVDIEQGNSLDYGQFLVEQNLHITNEYNKNFDITLEILDTTNNDGTNDIPFSRWIPLPSENAGWSAFTETLTQQYQNQETQTIRLAVRRAYLTTPGQYESILRVSSNNGIQIFIPASLTHKAEKTGLWVGTATINQVNNPMRSENPDDPVTITPVPTASELSFRIIIHVDANGVVRLLKEIIQMWDPGNDIRTAKFVLITNESLISNYVGAALRDGQPVGRRISSAVFSFPEPLIMAGSFLSGNTISCDYEISANDPLNPFKHQFHPDHQQGYDIKRIISMEFTDYDPTNINLSVAGWGDSDMGGIYKEEIHGLHKHTLYVEGNFRVHKISDIGELVQ